MKVKKTISKDIYAILVESGIPAQYWEKVLNKLTNYTYSKVCSPIEKVVEKEKWSYQQQLKEQVL